MPKREVIITGANGLIGSALTTHLRSERWTVHAVDIDSFNLQIPLHVHNMCRRYVDVPNLINCFAFNDHVSQTSDDRRTILDQDVDAFSEIMDVNVTSLFNVCQTYARLRTACGGNIINFGASTGIVSARTDMYGGNHKNAAYSISKAAVIHMTKILSTHFLSINRNFRVNCISPGGVVANQDDAFKQLYGTHTPTGRMMNVEELFPAVDMLLDARNSYMQGANIVVDGGWTVQ